jgi:predicted phage tail protein
VENHLQGLFTGDIYPDAYLKIHHEANKMTPVSRRAVKDATGQLVELAKALEITAEDTLQNPELLPQLITDTSDVADGVAEIAQGIADYKAREAAEEEANSEAEVAFLQEFQDQWQTKQDDESDGKMTKTDLFQAVQDANKALGRSKPNSSLLKGLREILEDDTDSKPTS